MYSRARRRRVRIVTAAIAVAACVAVLAPTSALGLSTPAASEPAAAAPTMRRSTVSIAVGDRNGSAAVTASEDAFAATNITAQAIPVFSSDFESGGTWNVSGWPAWGQSSFRRSQGNLSMYCVGNGVPAPGPYPPNAYTWMIAGPFDLSGYSSVALSFDVWMDLEYDEEYWTDTIFAGTGTDGVNFDGDLYDGNSDGWQSVAIPANGVVGSSHAYIGFCFESDDSIQYEGAYIDNVQIWAEPRPPIPVANPDTYAVSSGLQVMVPNPGVLGNDNGFGQSILARSLTLPTHGSIVSWDWLGGFIYDSTPGYLGTDSFNYQAYNAYGDSNIVPVTLNVVPNVAPNAVDDAYTMIKDRTTTVPHPGVIANDSDPIGDFLHAEVDTQPAHGTLVMSYGGGFDYTPDPGFVGTDSFTYHASDTLLSSPVRTVTINVVASPPMPVYRFYNARLGTHFYTADESEKNNVITRLSSIYQFEGVAYTLQPANNSAPLYRFYNRTSGTHFYTANSGERDRVMATLSHIYTYEGRAYDVSGDNGGGGKPAVYRFFRPSTGTHFYTANSGERDVVLQTLSHIYSYDGPAFYLGQ